MKAQTIAELLVLLAAKKQFRNLFGEEATAKLDSVSLSNDTVKRCMPEISVGNAEQVITGVKDFKFGFAIQLDKRTHFTKGSQFLVYVRLIRNNAWKTELLLSQELFVTMKGKDAFNVLAIFFDQKELDWKIMLVGCSTDSAPAVLGRKLGFQAYVKDVPLNATFVHCLIHRFSLCAKMLPSDLMSCLNIIIEIELHQNDGSKYPDF